jgi:Phytanoyl-CoA dioxygenase (PhyH)
MADPWSAFADDSDSDSDSEADTQVDHVGSFLTIYFRKISKVERVINHHVKSTDPDLFRISQDGPFDAFIIETGQMLSTQLIGKITDMIVPGGLLVFSNNKDFVEASFDEHIWEEAKSIFGAIVYRRFRPIQIARDKARWYKSNLKSERQRISVVALSAQERAQHRIFDDASINAAASFIHETGYCILTGLEDGAACCDYGATVLSDLHTAAKMLLEQPESVDLYHPCDSLNDPSAYKELSMREDCRMDLRDGPQLQKHRLNGSIPLRSHPDILRIVSAVMNPKPFTAANYGRMNFDGRLEPSITAGDVGGIVSLPGAADQTIHSDTPHLYEHIHLPAHYINAFTLGCTPDDSVGQTAFIHGSHRLDFVQKFIRSNTGDLDTSVYDFMVRPRMNLGDVVLFDCRILHFGLGNTSKDIERPLLYCNFTQPWFQDPKNWNKEASVFA